MKWSRYLFGTAMAVAVVMGMYGIQGVHAKSEKEYVPKAKVTTLVQGLLAGIEGKQVIIKHFELPAKFVGESIGILVLSLCTSLKASLRLIRKTEFKRSKQASCIRNHSRERCRGRI